MTKFFTVAAILGFLGCFNHFMNKKNAEVNQLLEHFVQDPFKKVENRANLNLSLNIIPCFHNGGNIQAKEKDQSIVITIKLYDRKLDWAKLVYKFSNREDYLAAIRYIREKGYRWILDNQYDVEYAARKEISRGWRPRTYSFNEPFTNWGEINCNSMTKLAKGQKVERMIDFLGGHFMIKE